MDVFEAAARDDASAEAGKFLERWKAENMPMVEIPREVWVDFIKVTIEAYQDSLRRQLLDHVVPF